MHYTTCIEAFIFMINKWLMLYSSSCRLTCGLLASASLHCRRNSLRFPQAMKGNSTMGFSPSSVHTWLMGNRFLKLKRKTSWGTETLRNRASIPLMYTCWSLLSQRGSWKIKAHVGGHPNITKLWKRKCHKILMLTSKRRKRKEWITMTTIFSTERKCTESPNLLIKLGQKVLN